MSKKTDSILLIPGPDGWELWQGTREQGFNQILDDGPVLASEMDKIPSGQLIMGFPVREALAIPFKAQTDDESMFDDLAAMHLEKIGVRPEEDAGQLIDIFQAGRDDAGTTLLSVVLAPPAVEAMPPRAPGKFDISARLFPMEDNAVTLWCELGRWVFAVTSGGRLTYFQSLPGTGITGDVVRDVRLALNQLRLQGVDLHVEKAVAWVSGRETDPGDEVIDAFAKALGVEVSVASKPSPVLPRPLSKLVPADVKAEQRKKAERMKLYLGIAAILLTYLALASYFGYHYWDINTQVKKQNAELKIISMEHGDIGLFYDRWDQLEPVVNDKRWPLNILKSAAYQIPLKQDLRFTEFDIKAGHITIQGEAGDVKVTSVYEGKLKRALPGYEWNTPPATSDSKTKRRKFNYEGILEGSEEE